MISNSFLLDSYFLALFIDIVKNIKFLFKIIQDKRMKNF